MGFFNKSKGAISVFLCLILLPVLVFGCMTVDASRIYMSKVVISDAGEMAMNAGLAQYNEELHDEYGLLVMNEAPQAMSGDLDAYFTESLNGTDLPGAEDYQKILDLLKENFEALNVAGAEIYQTEVEKQQILEYMKYRAPVCLTEEVLEKIQELKDTKKMAEATNAEMEFSESMEDCQNSFEKAKEALDALNDAINQIAGDHNIQQALDSAEKDYKEIVSRCLLMRELIQKYDEKSTKSDLKLMAESFIEAAKKVDLSVPYSSVSFEAYIDSMYYKNAVSHLGGIDKLLKSESTQEGQENSSEQASSNDEEQSSGSSSEDTQELKKIVDDYKYQESRIADYSTELLSTAKKTVNEHYEALKGYLNTSQAAKALADEAYKKLEQVKKKLKEAMKKFEVWDEKTDELEAIGKAGDMKAETDSYREFFSSGTGGSDLQQLEDLMQKVKNDKEYFENIQKYIKEEKFYDQEIATVSPASQTNRYRQEAEKAVSGIAADYSSEESVRNSYIQKYEHVTLKSSYELKSISDDPFYKRLQEYCKKQENENSKKEQDEANSNLQAGNNASAEVNNVEVPQYDWSAAEMTLPSVLIESADNSNLGDGLEGANVSTDVNDSGARRDTVSKTKDSISAAADFLGKVDEIVTKGLENLYIAEYAIQMFSYYTSNMLDGKEVPADNIISISGYPLQDHAAYRSECEYILWGNNLSQNNVRNTMMTIFGIRMLLNSFFAFSNSSIAGSARTAATAIAGAAPYLIPIVKVVIQLGYAGLETADDMSKIKQGYGVTLFKNADTWHTFPVNGKYGDNTSGVTFDYSEYLRIFLNISILFGNEKEILARTADCIQVNQPNVLLSESYTMVAIRAKIKARTTFMRKISDWGENGGWGFPDDYYTINYESMLGY